jgi:hypothetical protein
MPVGKPLSTNFRVVFHELKVPRPRKPVGIPLKVLGLAVIQVGNNLLRTPSNSNNTNPMQSTMEERLKLPKIDRSLRKPEVIRSTGEVAGRSHDSIKGAVKKKVEVLRGVVNLPISTTRRLEDKARNGVLWLEDPEPFARGGPLIDAPKHLTLVSGHSTGKCVPRLEFMSFQTKAPASFIGR